MWRKRYNYCLLFAFLAGLSFGTLSCSERGQKDKGHLVNKDYCMKLFAMSKNKTIADMTKKKDFKILRCVRLRNSRVFCCVSSANTVSAIVFSTDGNIVYFEPRILCFPDGGCLGPILANLKGGDSSRQLIVSVPQGPLPVVVEVKIIDFDGETTNVHTVTKYTYGYAEDGKRYGVFPALLTLGWNQQYLLIVRKSSTGVDPWEALEQIKWDKERGEYSVLRFSNKALVPTTAKSLWDTK